MIKRFFRRRVMYGGAIGAALIAAVLIAVDLHAPRTGGAPPAFRGNIAAFTAQPSPKPLPELQLQDAEGRPRTLADYRGKVVLLNYWATWCAPCIEEMPALDRLQARLGGDGFAVVPVSVDKESRESVLAFLDRLNVARLGTLLDRSGASMRALAIRGLPTTILVDREGREVGRLEGAAAWDSEAAEALIRHYLAPKA